MSRERTPILYDADCGFCRASLALVLAWDHRRRLRPVALQSQEADELLRGMPAERRMASWHLVEDDDTVRSAGAAVAPLARLLPAGTRPARAAGRFPAMTDRAYRWVARNRSTLGGLVPATLKQRASRLIRARS